MSQIKQSIEDLLTNAIASAKHADNSIDDSTGKRSSQVARTPDAFDIVPSRL